MSISLTFTVRRIVTAQAERILRDGLKIVPKSAMLHHSLGLALVRQKQTQDALAEFSRQRY
jgi:hypothetical protein